MPADRRYHLRRCLGRGGFGEVYLAVMQTGAVQTEVAVKLLSEGLDPGDQALERLRDEARILGLMNHPVILKVHDLLVLQGRVALVTEYVDGEDLEQCFASRDLPVRALVEVIARVADALGVAWSAPSPSGRPLELCHRDIKPANLRIGRHGDVKLLDFGIARVADLAREARTKTASVIGTLRYMAPERLDPETPSGPLADVYALGAVLYEGLAGQSLVQPLSLRETYLLGLDADEHAAFVRRRLEALQGAPEALVALLSSMLAYEAEARPSAAEVARRCEQLAEELPGVGLRRYCRERDWTRAPPPPGPLDGQTLSTESELPPRAVASTAPARRWPWLVAGLLALGGGALAAGAVVTGLAVVMLRPSTPAPAPAPATPVVAAPAPAPAPAPATPVVAAPAPAPVPSPQPAPAPAQGTFAVAGDVAVELRGGGRSYGPGTVPVGALEIWADFGDGPEPMGRTSVTEGASFVIRCSKLRHNCSGAP
jgi:hypothetical protein